MPEYSSSIIRKENISESPRITCLKVSSAQLDEQKFWCTENAYMRKKVKSTFLGFPFYVIINMFCQSEAYAHRGSVNQKQLLTEVLQKRCF